MGLRAFAPGRVNLIGDHTDYMGGMVLPMAIGLGTEITGDRGGNWVMLGSDRFEGVAEIPLGGVEDPAAVEPPWARYVAAVVDEIDPDDGLVGMVQSTLPAGSGLASSAALQVVVAPARGADLDDPLAVAEARCCASTATASPSTRSRSPRTQRSRCSTRASTAS